MAAGNGNASNGNPTNGNASNGDSNNGKPTIVLVHGAWADGTAWQHVIPRLERDGYSVIAVQNPLSSLADDVATTRRVIRDQKGPVVVAAHSYGGMVMSGAAAGEPNVQALVYVAAFAPDGGESIVDVASTFAPAPGGAALTPASDGYLYIDRERFHEAFCADVPEDEARIMAAAQKPLAAAIFGQTYDDAAWKTIPSWYLVSQDDRMINPDQERFYARRMNATTREIEASHVSLVSCPAEVTRLIADAARATAPALHEAPSTF